MNRRPRLAGLLAACSLFLALTSCAELKQMLPPSGPALATSKDSTIKAAGEASDAVTRERQAQALVNTAIETRNTNPAAEAVKLRPADPYYSLTLYALQIALQQKTDSRLIPMAAGLIYSQHSELSPPDRIQLFYIYFLDALITTNKFAKGTPESTRLLQAYCESLADYRAYIGPERADLLYSAEGCPSAKP